MRKTRKYKRRKRKRTRKKRFYSTIQNIPSIITTKHAKKDATKNTRNTGYETK